MQSFISSHWNGYLGMFPQGWADIYYTEEYVKLYESDNSDALCVICQENSKVLLMPFIRKSIGSYFDFETAYGYGGPIANNDGREWIGSALDEMLGCFRRERYLCGFIRFHPLLNNAYYLKDKEDVRDKKGEENRKNKIAVLLDRTTIAVDTSMPEDDIWKSQLTSKNRNMVRKAQKQGLSYRAEHDFASMDEFVAVYHATMDRLGADSFYFFDGNYYQEYRKNMQGKGFLGTVRLEGELVGAALFMYAHGYGHYHLAGSSRGHSSLGINNFLLWNTICEMKKLGVGEFHLGGGAGASPDDSLFKFKRSFSNCRKEFYIGKCIFYPDIYEKVCRDWEVKNKEKAAVYGKRLLRYRY